MKIIYGAKYNSKGQRKCLIVNHETKKYDTFTNGSSEYRYDYSYPSIEVTSLNKVKNELDYNGYLYTSDIN